MVGDGGLSCNTCSFPVLKTEFSLQREDLRMEPALRERLMGLPSRSPEDHEILLQFEERSKTVNNGKKETKFKVAHLIIKSGARNALSGRMICQLSDKLDELEKWLTDDSQRSDLDARCLIIRGHGGTFCSGSDLMGVRQVLDEDGARQVAQLMQHNLARIENLPIISVAFIEGYALGGGAEIILAADLRLMSDSGRIGYVHARNGICCGWGGGVRLMELLGKSRTVEVLSSGRLIGVEEAIRLGLCSKRAENLDKAIEFALEHAIESRITSRAVKTLINSSGRLPFGSALKLERELIAGTWGREAHLHALNVNLKHK